MRRLLIIPLLFAFILAGCLQPPQALGCCLKANASLGQGCVLYNLTSFTNTDLTGQTNGCSNTTGHCNVTIGGTAYLLPICSQDDIVPCISGNCTAMVCGDFAFQPKIAPGFNSVSNSSSTTSDTTNEISGNVPAGNNKQSAQQFYKAQCRFLPMDANLKNVMSNSNSQINVFRLGVGGSFDEFDQYRYYFPISDKFCNVNPVQNIGDVRVDRYMNYIDGSANAYDPLDNTTGILRDCVDGSISLPPLGYSESNAAQSTNIPGINGYPSVTASYTTPVPDAHNYKFSNNIRVDAYAQFSSQGGGVYIYPTPFTNQNNVYKTLDNGYYSRALSIAYVNDIYDTANTGTTRAPFECDPAKNECYSGTCDTSIYNRGVLQEYSNTSGLVAENEIVGDCNRITDVNGETRVVCAPTTSVTPNGSNPPTIAYASVNIAIDHFESGPGQYGIDGDTSGQNYSSLDSTWNNLVNIATSSSNNFHAGGTLPLTNVVNSFSVAYTKRVSCYWDYPGVSSSDANANDSVLCSFYDGGDPSAGGPPAGGAVFFGSLGNNSVKYNGKTIIGYVIASPSDINSIEMVKNCNLQNGTDYIPVKISGINDPNWKTLMTDFQPYFDDRMKAEKQQGTNDGCGNTYDYNDEVLSSIPWVINFQKGVFEKIFNNAEVNNLGIFMSATTAQAIRSRNTYDLPMNGLADTSSCSLRQSSLWYLPYYYSSYGSLGGHAYSLYDDVLFSQNIYLIAYTPTSGKIGKCSVDDTTGLPKITTYGWCQPCTTSTLAYQNVTAYNRVYIPLDTVKVDSSGNAVDQKQICIAQYNSTGWDLFNGGTQWTDNVSCYNPSITDISDYKESIGSIGSPKTVPEASIMKERLGNYLKSGVLPVLDLSDPSNWNLTNPDQSIPHFCLFYFAGDCSQSNTYQQYDFQRLIGTMGAAVIIVDHVGTTPTTQQINDILNRTGVVRGSCFGCLTAVNIDTPTSLDNMNQSITGVLSDPRIDFNLDMFTFNYPVSAHDSVVSGVTDIQNASQLIVDDIASYGRLSLEIGGKPTMVVGFNVNNSDGVWNNANFQTLFDTITVKQQELVKAGVVGVIYSPARSAGGNSGTGIVSLNGAGVGSETPKFCALQDAMYKMTTNSPVALFTLSQVINQTNCTPCTSSDYSSLVCVKGSTTVDARKCDDGIECTVPAGGDPPSWYKCPMTTSVGNCQLCNDTANVGKTVSCTYTYTNGSTNTTSFPMTSINSDSYADVLGGLPRPNKCCLVDAHKNLYTYTKQTYSSPLNVPLTFPANGDPNIDCGLGSTDSNTISQLSSFCNIKIPIKSYDINCSIS